METENEGNEKNLSVVGVWLLRKLRERMETEKPNPFLGGQIYCLVAKKMKEMEKRMRLFFFWEFLNLWWTFIYLALIAISNTPYSQNTLPSNVLTKLRSLMLGVVVDPDAEVMALSPKTLMATNQFMREICNKGFQRDQNL